MVFRRRGFRPIVKATKNIAETSSIIAATTNLNLINITDSVESSAVALSDANGIAKNSKVFSFFASIFIISEGGEVANEVPLVDWYVIKDQGGMMTNEGFDPDGLPTPGDTGRHQNKRFIFHTEKGLTGGGLSSLAGIPMIFKGVIKVPRGFQTHRINDKIVFCIRTNFASKICVQFIYKWYE